MKANSFVFLFLTEVKRPGNIPDCMKYDFGISKTLVHKSPVEEMQNFFQLQMA